MIHFWDLPQDRIHIRLKEQFKTGLIDELLKQTVTIRNAGISTGCSINTLRRLKRKERKIKINLVTKISKILNSEKYSLSNIEKNVTWIGHPLNVGIEHPKLPFNFSTRHGARFIAAIFNDGYISKHYQNPAWLMYDNFDKGLRESVKKDLIKVTGGDINSLPEFISKKKKFIAFPSIFRDILLQFVIPGPKSENNQNTPGFILNNNELMLGWLEQTIADEGEVKYFPKRYRRSIVWRRSVDITNKFPTKLTKEKSIRKLPKEVQKIVERQKCNLIQDELRMLKILGIDYDLYNLGVYPTSKGKIRTRWQISITKRKNLLRLRRMIKIPHMEKDKKFTLMMKGFVRYKEPLNIRNAIKRIQKKNGFVTSGYLKKAMNYKNIGNASVWLRILENEGFLVMIKKSTYGKNYREPARYIIRQK